MFRACGPAGDAIAASPAGGRAAEGRPGSPARTACGPTRAPARGRPPDLGAPGPAATAPPRIPGRAGRRLGGSRPGRFPSLQRHISIQPGRPIPRTPGRAGRRARAAGIPAPVRPFKPRMRHPAWRRHILATRHVPVFVPAAIGATRMSRLAPYPILLYPRYTHPK